jgi:hypothetical protein
MRHIGAGGRGTWLRFIRLRHENGDTHVVICDDVFSDAGSNPAASTNQNPELCSGFFIGGGGGFLWHKRRLRLRLVAPTPPPRYRAVLAVSYWWRRRISVAQVRPSACLSGTNSRRAKGCGLPECRNPNCIEGPLEHCISWLSLQP